MNLTNYIKICPNCDHINPEGKNKCLKCGYFLGDVEPILESEVSGSEEQHHDEPVDDPLPHPDENEHESGPDETGEEPPVDSRRPLLCLAYSGKVYKISSGMVMGRADATSSADIQIPSLPSYVHRNHCRFHYDDCCERSDSAPKIPGWYVEAIENSPRTNPTFLNGEEITPRDSQLLLDGDRLTLCDIHFGIKIQS